MIPSAVAWQLKHGLSDYVQSSFPISNPYFERAVEKYVTEDGSLYHEPYFAIKMPFRSAAGFQSAFKSFSIPYIPHLHQSRSFERLLGGNPKPTIIATGTGSGKTECFLYPILEYCYQHRMEPGIKALLIYPMNALATDQAKRIAEMIYSNAELKNNVTVGMFVGDRSEKPSKVMSEHDVITDHDTILGTPPSILMTNYKMLDYLLVRPKDAKIWNNNTERTLKFLVVDELHTFDGAQGTDLACLVRRLKKRIGTPKDYLCPIGTSATIGNESAYSAILTYASEIFDTSFEKDSLILEDRISVDELLENYSVEYDRIPHNSDIEVLSESLNTDDELTFIQKSITYWFEEDHSDVFSNDTRCKLSEMIKKHTFFRDLLKFTEGKYFQSRPLFEELATRYSQLSTIDNYDVLFNSAIALVSHARINNKGRISPFLSVHVELWLKELSRAVSTVTPDETQLCSAFDLNDEQLAHANPLVTCRDCGNTAWISRANDRHSFSVTDLNLLYDSFFSGNNSIMMAYPSTDSKRYPDMNPGWICPECMTIYGEGQTNDICPSCDCTMVHVFIPRNQTIRDLFICPVCHSKRGLGLFGFRGKTELSVCISQLFSSRFNNDKKAISFTDNVQDAAHNSSYFNFKTNRFILRNSIQQFVDREGANLPLNEFSTRYTDYLRQSMSDEEFVSVYIPPKITWMRAYEQMIKDGYLEESRDKEALIKSIINRLKYEIVLEYGLESKNGRTLTSSCTSTLQFDPQIIEDIAVKVKAYCDDNITGLSDCSLLVHEEIVYAIIDQMRYRGAFDIPVYSSPVKSNNFFVLKDTKKWMPAIRSGRNTPHFLTNTIDSFKKADLFDNLQSAVYTRIIKKILPDTLSISDLSEVVKAVGVVSNELGLLNVIPNDKYEVWGIDPSKIIVTNRVVALECNCCGFRSYVAEDNLRFVEGTPCSVVGCNGNYIKADKLDTYYHNLYRNADISRIHSDEHTGLLTRAKREAVEQSFKKDGSERRPWDVNLLSATPTLEMGIDVGSLSTTLMSSVPPGQSQFLQRSGRAGRRDGNSLNLVLSRNNPYDQYYYADPMEMISGIVDCPRIFLSASAVLSRQYVAFCMDSWIKNESTSVKIPSRLNICLNSINEPEKDVFPHNFIKYAKDNSDSLFASFVDLFKDKLKAETIEELHKFVFGEGNEDCPMHTEVREVFLEVNRQRTSLLNNVKRCKTLIAEIEAKPHDSSFENNIKELADERDAYLRVVQEIQKKNVFNFMSDEGLLPNYAFPESGMILKAVLFKERPEGGSQNAPVDKEYYEYQRPSASAITEFAPSNQFCAEGHALSIDRIDVPTSNIENWRLCPNCSHIAINSMIQNTSSCPNCGCVEWSDNGQVKPMMKAKMVYSFGKYENLIDDSRDDRKIVSYNKQTLVDVDETHDIIKAYSMDNSEYTFGYEIVRNATIREINFGVNSDMGTTMQVAGIQSKRSGFTICKQCGRIQTGKGGRHTADCKFKNSAAEAEYEECTFLYRELKTEALRVLIPTVTASSLDHHVESFVAAFMLGMREYFGNVDHLKTTVSTIPISSDFSKMYLVIYDSIPGGTGYLKQLLQDNSSMVQILEKAKKRLETCQCTKDPNKDGCYHCLYTYRQSKSVGLSRDDAIEMLKTILSGKDTIKEVHSLSKIEVNGLFDSALEAKFIATLEDYCKRNKGQCTFQTTDRNNKKCYEMTINGNKWTIEPQYPLDESFGVVVNCKPDFMFIPPRNKPGLKPIAVFTDGFQFHHYKADDDTLKRMAIIHSDKFRVWSLSWKDVNLSAKSHIDHAVRTLSYDNMPSPQMYLANVSNYNVADIDPSMVNAFELFLNYLGNENAEDAFTMRSKAYAQALLSAEQSKSDVVRHVWFAKYSTIEKEVSISTIADHYDNYIIGENDPTQYGGIIELSCVDMNDYRTKKIDAEFTVYIQLDDENVEDMKQYERRWNGFFHLINVMQFLGRSFVAVTKNGLYKGVYGPIMK